jgi:uncharacterized protein YggU (UPF0235/DUF167 family)
VIADPWRTISGGILIACRLTPKGGRNAIEGVSTLSDGARVLVARVRAAPEDGKANAALCALIAEKLGVAASSVTVLAGARSRIKQIGVTGDPSVLIARLSSLQGSTVSESLRQR